VSGIDMFFSEIGPYLLAFDARVVETIADVRAASGDSIDLAGRLADGATTFADARPRRLLRLAASRGTIGVVAGEAIWTGTLASDALLPLPTLLAGPLRVAGIGSLFLDTAGRFGYIFDPEAL
jgi:hypothetical protein